MTRNLTQYGTIFDAIGCELRYNSSDATISVVSEPKGMKKIVDKALSEIKHFDDTTNYADGMAALCISDYIDDDKNPIEEDTRLSIMNALGLMVAGKYISQALMLQKNNRSWHYSEVANECSYFGEECTHRGINPDPERKGRRSNRKPNEYHVLDGRGEVKREQLVTNGLEKLFRSIPSENLATTGRIAAQLTRFDVKGFSNLSVDAKSEFIARLKEAI